MPEKARGKDSIWSNAFKSGGIIPGTSLMKNGIKSRVALSSINTTGVATIAYSYSAAIMAIVQGKVSAAKLADGSYWTECESFKHSGRKYLLQYFPKEKDLRAAVVERGMPIVFNLVGESFAHWSIFVPRVVQLIAESSPEGEFAVNFNEVLKQYRERSIVTNPNEMYILNDYLYESQHDYIQRNGEIKDMEVFESREPVEVDLTEKLVGHGGRFEYVDRGKEKKSEASKTSKRLSIPTTEYYLEWDRELTKEEKALIPKLDFEIIRIPKEIKELAQIIKEEINSFKPVRNILMYGEAGAGKSTGARILAQLLGLPYRFINCSLNTEESDFIGTFKPTPEGGFEFWMPSFAQSFVYGGLIEVQEPTTLKSGVGVILNSATDDTAQITLGDGRIVPRHKNCIIVFTTNIDYAGCNRLNESLKDRFNQMIHIKKLPNEELIRITMEQSGNNDRALVEKLVDAVQKISIKIEEEQITGGVCSTRQLINWAQDIKYTLDPIRSARKTILPGVSLDLEVQEEIIETILKPLF